MRVSYIINIVCPLHVSAVFVAFLREVHCEGYTTEVFDSVHKCKIHLFVFILHELGLVRPISSSSNKLFKFFLVVFIHLVYNSALFLASCCSFLSYCQLFQNFFIPFVVKKGVPGCYSENFYLDWCQ